MFKGKLPKTNHWGHKYNIDTPRLARSMEIKFTYIKELSDYTVNTSLLTYSGLRLDLKEPTVLSDLGLYTAKIDKDI